MATFPNITAGKKLTADLLASMLPQYIYKTAATDRVGTTTLTADPDLRVELEAGAVYCVEMYIYFGGEHDDDSAGDGDFTTSWSVPSGASGLKSVIGPGANAPLSSLAHTVDTVRLGVHNLGTNVSYACVRNVTTNVQLAYEQAIVTTVAAGTLALMWAQEDPDATPTRVAEGSFMRVTRIG